MAVDHERRRNAQHSPQARRLFLTNRQVGVLRVGLVGRERPDLHREGGLARVDVASPARLVGAATGKAKAMSLRCRRSTRPRPERGGRAL
jgi:hypothetical protein